jgi:hypothetical protein
MWQMNKYGGLQRREEYTGHSMVPIQQNLKQMQDVM